MEINNILTLEQLKPKLNRLFQLSGQKILAIEETWDSKQGTPVFTAKGKYTTRGWTEWTQGFQFGSALLQFDATGNSQFLDIARKSIIEKMATHVSHIGVHDHGFNNISTYGNLRRLILERLIERNDWEIHFCEMALKASAAVQASRWTSIHNGKGYIYSFNGPHSLFSDTMRSLRVLGIGHQLGHVLMGEGDREISLLKRLIHHSKTNAKYNVYYGEERDRYDVRGRVVHESIFNINDGNYRCPSTQQGYSPFTTWTRGLAWVITGYAEQLEFFDTLSDKDLQPFGDRLKVSSHMIRAAKATADFYIKNTPIDGIPYWDTGAPGLSQLGDYLDQSSDPFNDYEPIDSSAAAITGQGLVRLGKYLQDHNEIELGVAYYQAGLTIADTLLEPPYLSEPENHQGLLLHSIYHHPNGWDYCPKDYKIPCGESSMWGDYHLREFALLLMRLSENKPYLTFFSNGD